MKKPELKQIIKENIYINKYNIVTVNDPIIPDVIKILSKNKNAIKFSNKASFDSFARKQKYFSASHSHCFYTKKEMDDFHKNGSVNTIDGEKSDILFDTGHRPVQVWDEKNKIGYIIPSDINESNFKNNLKRFIKEEIQKLRLVEFSKDLETIQYLRAIRELENDLTDLDQLFSFDNPGEYISQLLGTPSIENMSRNEIRNNKNLLKKVKIELEKRNNTIFKEIEQIKNKIFQKYPLLKTIEKREMKDSDDSILFAQEVYKDGKGYSITTPNMYNDDITLSTNEVEELKKYILATGKKLKINRK